ncbi:PhzF family phenazine biosynthesis protein [Longispora albida]|uniref:PhzF family phenazine biosynthesis protein n=1 Tax=Longispora albida TaxID=203523 RepID=UPI000369E224|nr:PhzF family phenazine biosynthesis isomerase [Longispora albida]
MSRPAVAIVNACLRDGLGGSPTAVLAEDPDLSEDQRRAVPVRSGTSHAVFVSRAGDAVSLRFYTATGELPACGHGTVAALAHLAAEAGTSEYTTMLRAGGRLFTGQATAAAGQYSATFDPGPVTLQPARDTPAVLAILSALGLGSRNLVTEDLCVASAGRPRLLVPVPSRPVLDSLAPDPDQLRAACDHSGLLGCYVYTVPSPTGRTAARMFAPSIGVPEDIANANSTACLAGYLASRDGTATVTSDMGDSLGAPATITATASRTTAGLAVQAGGAASVNA